MKKGEEADMDKEIHEEIILSMIDCEGCYQHL